MVARWLLAILVVASSVSSRTAVALDRPISAVRLTIRTHGAQQWLIFTSKDPAVLFPTIGGLDDPVSSPSGALIDVFEGGVLARVIPASGGSANPGWTSHAGKRPVYQYRNGAAPGGPSPVRILRLRYGKGLTFTTRTTDLPFDAPLGSVGVRITTGSLRSCALFAPGTIQRDAVGHFVARGATAAALIDCSDTTFTGTPTTTTLPSCGTSVFPQCDGPCPGDGTCIPDFGGCHCVSPGDPCGGTGPLCNGACPAGEECVGNGPGPLHGCVCLPVGSTPCGTPGAPVCGGECPAGQVCRGVFDLPILGGQVGCVCAAPGNCGQGGADCGNGFACGVTPPGGPTCFPVFCNGGSYPTCGGTCVPGAECTPLHVPAISFDACVCAVPAPCDATCGGYGSCPSGEVCTVDTTGGPSCGCGAP